MSLDFEPSRSTGSSKEDELTPEERFRQIIEKHLDGHDLQSPRVQAYCDFADLQTVDIRQPWGDTSYYNQDMIIETIRQRINGIKYYKREIEQIFGMTNNYKKELEKRYGISEAKTKYFQGLMDIKNRAIDKITQQSQTLTQQ